MPLRKLKRALEQPACAMSLHASVGCGSNMDPPKGPHGCVAMTTTGLSFTATNADRELHEPGTGILTSSSARSWALGTPS